MNEKVAGVSVPERYIKMMAGAKKGERAEVSVKIASELIRGMKDLCQGVHIMPLGWGKYVPRVLEEVGLVKKE